MSIIPNPILTVNPGGAIIGFNNVLSSSTTQEAKKMLTPNTFERFRPAAATITTKFQIEGGLTDINYIAIAAHNLTGDTLLIQTAETVGGALTSVASVLFPNDRPVMVRFDTRAVQEVAITATYSADKEIGVIYAGISLDMPRALYGGHTPLALAQQTSYQSTESETGQFLGRTITRQGLKSSFSWQFLDPDFYRDVFQVFVLSARVRPFFIMWRPDFYSLEVSYGHTIADIKPSNMGGGHRLMAVTFEIKAHADL